MDKKYDFKVIEPKLQLLWEKEGIYAYRNGREKEVFSIDTPPPTVSGSLHIGHVFSYTQAEMIARFKRMQNYDVFYPFGFDDNGLPTERLVEREEKIRAREVPRSDFYDSCMRTIGRYEEDFKKMWQSLGFSVDWSLQYQTISKSSQRISQRSFLELVRENKAYMKESPVLWCTECHTSIAQAELETRDTDTAFNYLSFMTPSGPMVIATTRPEFLYGCVCIFVNPQDSRYTTFIGSKARVPLYDFEVPVIADEQASPEKGSGAVMCCTFGDMTDVEWYKKYHLPYKNILCEDGKISSQVPLIGGLGIRQARSRILEKLKEAGVLIRQESITHSVAVHERCGTEVEIIPSRQWYIEVMPEKERFLKAADEIRWHPDYMKNRYKIWVENLKWDWCISRQRYFGVPFPVWYCKECKAPVFAEEDQLPVNPLEDRPRHGCSCGCQEVIPENAVFDTWATSSVTPLINARYKEEDDRSRELLPMGMRCQAHEIIRTWAFYTIVKSLYHTGRIPWKDIMISGFVLAKPGEKISKSRNNSSGEPMQLIETHSADAIRYWAAGAKLGTDTFFNEEELKISKRFLTKLYNAAGFAILHLADYEKRKMPAGSLLPVDRWILQRVNETTGRAVDLLNDYETGQARHEIDELFWRDFCDYYIEIVKERLYQPEKHGYKERSSGQYAIYHSLYGILKLYAIYVPHMTDYIYQQFYRKYETEISLHRTVWSTEEKDALILEYGEQLKLIISEVRKSKTERQLSMKDEIPEIIVRCPNKLMKYFKSTEMDIKACTNAQRIVYRA